jgi:GNAT superfamily N-acetyltransferase
LNIRVFSEADAEELSKVILETLYVSNSRDYTKEILDKQAPKYSPPRLIEKAKTRYVLVAEENGKIIGTAQLDKDNIKAMFVLPSMQSRGVGKALVNCI